MFTRRGFYHPYRPPGPASPAGFRVADYIRPRGCLFQDLDTRSPDSSPMGSPVRGQHEPQNDQPPTLSLAELFAENGFGSPQRPSSPSPDHPRNATPRVRQTNVRAHEPFPIPPPRKRRYGPKHLSFNKDALHRAQQLKERRDAARKKIFNRHERRVVRTGEHIEDLRYEAEALMKPERMNEQDRIFLKQLQDLHLDQVLKHDLEECRQRMTRAANESTARRREQEERDEEAAKMWGPDQDEEAREEQERKVEAFVEAQTGRKEVLRRAEEEALRADEERQRIHEAQERKIREEQERLFRQGLARKAKEEEERRKREERVRQAREERERQAREARERQLREERERQLREERERRAREERERELREDKERKLREEAERVRREAHEQLLREENARRLLEEVERLRRAAYDHFLREERERLAREEERRARIEAEQARRAAQDDQTRQQFVLYEAKWNELRTNNSLPLVDVREMPWPVFGVVSSAEQITYQEVRTFLFHPLRPGVEGKTGRDKVKSEVLRFHPDKFNARILPKILPSQQAVAEKIAGAIARILTRIMTEEAGEQK